LFISEPEHFSNLLPVSGEFCVNEKAELIIESNPDDMGLRARCSLCGTRFDLSGNRLTEKQLLRGLFDLHLRRLHSPAGDDSALDSDEK
jgi:hypothetical protein